MRSAPRWRRSMIRMRAARRCVTCSSVVFTRSRISALRSQRPKAAIPSAPMRQRRSLVKYWPSSARSRRDAGHALYVPFPPASTSGNIAHVDATADDELRRRLTDLLSGASSNGGRLGRATQRAVRGLVDRGDFAGALRTMTATLAEATAPVTTHERDEFSKLARELSIDQELGPVLARCPSIPIENDIAATRERDVKLLKIGIGVILIFAG